MKKLFIILLTVATLAVSLTGCQFPIRTNTDDSAEVSSVALIIGKNRIQGRLSIDSDTVTKAIQDAAYSCGKLTAIILDGDSQVVFSQRVTEDSLNHTKQRTTAIANETISNMVAAVNSAEPTKEEIDVISAFNTAIDALTASDAVGTKKVYVLTSGLSSAGKLNMRTLDFFRSDPQKLAEVISPYMRSCEGVEFYFLDMGETNQQFQQKPDNVQLEQMKAFYKALIELKGGTANFLTDATSNKVDGADYPNVTPIDLRTEEISGADIASLISEDKIGFIPKTAKFVDKQAAVEYIREIAQSLVASQKEVLLIGSTATAGTVDSCMSLSLARAEAVKQLLIEMGVDASKIKTVGIGQSPDSPLRVLDVVNGTLIESEARKNRFVYVTTDMDIAY